jgi:predicted Zn-ribbon and HTH transcriptional regulator
MENENKSIDTKINIIKTVGEVKQIGDSYYIHIDKSIRKHLHVEKGVVLGMKLWNIETKEIKCPKCEYEFVDYSDNDPHDCPNCGKEILDVDIKEVINEGEKDETIN